MSRFRKMKGNTPHMLLKLDLEKAFDKLEWSFIQHTLVSLKFPPNFIKLIMSCVTTTSTPILINGNPTNYFKPSWDIRQGDPLSPYLFILCLEMLSRSINTAVDYRSWQSISLASRCPLISHLFFAYDIILTAKITPLTCNSIIDTLNHFTAHSGQNINFHKSKIFFSKNCSTTTKPSVLHLFHMHEGKTFGKYLGFPIFVKQPSKSDFQFLLDNFKNRLAEWKTKFLTKAGRTTLIRSTLNHLPNHVM